MNESLSALLQHPQLYVRQKKEWVEILIDWETSNRYSILDGEKNEVGLLAERGGGIGAKLKRWAMRSHRGFEIDVFDKTGQILLHLSRSFFFLFSDLHVIAHDGRRQGSLHRRFGILYKKYDLKDAAGHTFATIRGPRWRLWTFPIKDLSGNTRATIAKRWGGGLREIFTDADTYQVDFGQHSWTPEQRAVILAAAISVDFDFFENNQKSGSVTDLLDFLPD